MFKQLLIASFIFGSTISLSAQSYQREISIKDTITDRELIVPEEIERNFDQLLIDWKKDLKPSLSCKSNFDTNVAYPDSVYINRLYSLPTEMELVYNPIVRSYIDMYTGRMRSSVEYFLGKSHYFFPIFEQALDKYGLPLELKYLPIIESALNPTIASRMGATGLWQFMIGTGKMYELEINSLVDERRDPIRSTDAAARYLKDLFNIYGDWNLVIAAYNCGPGNVNKAIRRSGGKSDYWAIYQYLPKETRGYVPAFIAATYVMNYHSEHNICAFDYKYTHSTDTIVVDKQLHLQQLADVLNVPIDEVRNLNPQFKKDIVPGEFKSYVVTLPSTQATDFEVQKESVYAYRTNDLLVHRKVVEPSGVNSNTTKIRHKVRKGESLSSIASKHGVTAKQIRGWNRLSSNKVRTGQILAINKTVAKPKTSTESQNEQYYAENKSTITTNTSAQPEDKTSENREAASSVLAEYFSKYSEANTRTVDSSSSPVVTASAVLASNEKENGTDEDSAEETRTPNEPQTIYHKVRIGETLALIATKYNVDKDDISSWNKLKSSIPKIGQRLVIHLPLKPEKTNEELIDENERLSAPEPENSLLAEQSVNQDDNFSQYRSAAPVVSVNTEFEKDESLSKETNTVAEPKKKAAKSTKKTSVYTVKKGDTLGHIVSKFGGKMTPKDVMKANKLTSDKLKIGQKLKIPR